jgi:hypothetical protein
LRLYDQDNTQAAYAACDLSKKKEVSFNLHELKKTDGKELDLSHLFYAAFTSDGSTALYVKEIFLSDDGVNPGHARVTVEQITALIDQYLQNDGSVTITDITALIDRYLEQEN